MHERDMFLAALDIPDAAARQAFLDRVCAGEPERRAAVEALLRAHGDVGSFLAEPLLEQSGPAALSRPADTKKLPDVADEVVSSPDALERTQSFPQADPEGLLDGLLEPSDEPETLGRLGHYRVERVLGRGAFGTVVLAFDDRLHRAVAIKLMSAELALTSPARKRFLREARSAAGVRHEYVVQIYSVESTPVPYLVMEYVPGRTLDVRLQQHGPLAVPDVLRIGGQIASGLAAAHALGLVHRDIKPANILLEEGAPDRAKITDFGLARAADDASLTQSGLIAGTPMYMSPEQAHGRTLDQRSDLFSLGSVLYQMVTGRPPFRAESTLAVLKRVTEDTPRPIQDIIPETPDWLATIIGKLHARNPDERIQSAQERTELLQSCARELERGRTPELPWPTVSLARWSAPTISLSQLAQAAPRRQRGRLVGRAAGLAGLAVIVALAEMAGVTRLSSLMVSHTPREETRPIETVHSGVASSADGATVGRDVKNKQEPELPMTPEPTVAPPVDLDASGWAGWPVDAPAPALAPFDAAEARKRQQAWADYLKAPPEFTNSLDMQFRLVPPGEFMMGSTAVEIAASHKVAPAGDARSHAAFDSEAPQHIVRLTRAVYMSVHEVTQGQYAQLTGKTPSYWSPTGDGKRAVELVDTADFPVDGVSWHDAAQFCIQLSEREERLPRYKMDEVATTIIDGNGYRLPTEAEWEFACRAGSTTRYSSGDSQSDLAAVGWFAVNARGRPHGVGELSDNAFGLHDLHGNIWEWCQDWWKPKSFDGFVDSPAVDPTGPSIPGAGRIIRGGHWGLDPAHCHAGSRMQSYPADYNRYCGFRIVLPISRPRVRP